MAKAKLSKEFVEYMFQFQMDHLKQANLEVRQSTIDRLAKALFDVRLGDKQWPTKQKVTRCILFGASQIWKNTILCIFKEKLGLGTKYYHIIAHRDVLSMTRIQCLIRMLPHKKMVFELDLKRDPLHCDLTFSSQTKKVQAIAKQEIPLEDQPNFCTICKTTIGHPVPWAWLSYPFFFVSFKPDGLCWSKPNLVIHNSNVYFNPV